MKSKNLAFLCAGVLALVFLTSFALAEITFSNQSISLTNKDNSGTLTFTSDEAFNITTDFPSSGLEQTFGDVKFTLIPTTDLEDVTSVTFSVEADEIAELDFFDESFTTFTLSAVNASDSEDTTTFNIVANYENTEYCTEESSNNLDITIEDVNTISGFGDDEDFWYPGDEVEIDINVEYNGGNRDEFQDGEVNWVLYSESGEEIMDGDENLKDLEDGDDETVTITIKLDPKDLDVNTDRYTLYVSVTGTEDFDDNSEEDIDICASDSESYDINIDNNFVVLDNIEYNPDPVSCGGEVIVTADVWNVGSDDQDDVMVRIFIEDGITFNQEVEMGDMDAFDREKLEFRFDVPTNAEDKTYHLRLWVYDDDNDVFQNDEDDYAKYDIPFVVSGGCKVIPEVLITAFLESGGKAGDEAVVKATITNSGDNLGTFKLTVSEYESFAKSAELSQETLAIEAGQSKEVLITLDVNKDASGEDSFSLAVSSDGEVLARQPITITITPRTGGITGGVIGLNSDNWYLWGIGALNVILVIIIIVVAIRIARS